MSVSSSQVTRRIIGVATIRLVSTDSPYTVLSTDEVIFCDTDAGAITVNLPAGLSGVHYKVINCGSSGNSVTVDGNSTETVSGSLTQGVNDGENIDLHYDSTEGWY